MPPAIRTTRVPPGKLTAVSPSPCRAAATATALVPDELVSPGTFFGPSGEGYWRLALVPTEAECERAAEILERVL